MTKIEELLKKAKDYFSKENLPFNISVDEDKVRVEKFILALTEKTSIEKFEELLLVDGTTKVTIAPAVEVGAAIALYDAEGMPIAAPIAEYELADGRVIVVEVDGIIAAIKEVEEELEGESKPNNQASNEPAIKQLIERIETEKIFESITSLKKDSEDFKTKFELLTKENLALKADLLEFKKFNKETLEVLLQEPEKVAVTPVSNPFGKSKSGNMFEEFQIKK